MLIGVDSFSAILLTVTQLPAETARHFVAVGVIAWIVGPPLLLVVAVTVVLLLRSGVLTLLLASVFC